MQVELPTIEEIIALHKKHAKSDGVFDLVYTHSQIVAEIAQKINIDKELGLDPEFIRIAGLIHDIGAYAFIDEHGVFDGPNYVCHGHTGYAFLKEANFPEELCRIAERHTGVGISEKEIVERNIPVPPKDYFAETLEEELIMYADKFHSKKPRFNSYKSYKKTISKYGEVKVAKFEEFATRFGIPDVQELADKYHMRVD